MHWRTFSHTTISPIRSFHGWWGVFFAFGITQQNVLGCNVPCYTPPSHTHTHKTQNTTHCHYLKTFQHPGTPISASLKAHALQVKSVNWGFVFSYRELSLASWFLCSSLSSEMPPPPNGKKVESRGLQEKWISNVHKERTESKEGMVMRKQEEKPYQSSSHNSILVGTQPVLLCWAGCNE